MTDKDGVFRDYSIPPGYCNPTYIDQMKLEASNIWPDPVAKLIQHTSAPFIQAIHEFMPQFLVQGRVCLVGDAAHLARFAATFCVWLIKIDLILELVLEWLWKIL